MEAARPPGSLVAPTAAPQWGPTRIMPREAAGAKASRPPAGRAQEKLERSRGAPARRADGGERTSGRGRRRRSAARNGNSERAEGGRAKGTEGADGAVCCSAAEGVTRNRVWVENGGARPRTADQKSGSFTAAAAAPATPQVFASPASRGRLLPRQVRRPWACPRPPSPEPSPARMARVARGAWSRAIVVACMKAAA